MSVRTESNLQEYCEGEQTLDSLTDYQEDPMPELLYGLSELAKYHKSLFKQDPMIDTASEKTMSHYSSMSDLTEWCDMESLSLDVGKEADEDDVILINGNPDEYQPPRISSPRNYRKFLKTVVDIPDPPSWRKGTASGANSYRPESVMSDAMSSLTHDEELAREHWMREVEEIHGRFIGRKKEKEQQKKKQTWSVGSEEPFSDSCEDDIELDLEDEKVYRKWQQKFYEIYHLGQMGYPPYYMSIVSDREEGSITPLPEEPVKEEAKEPKAGKKNMFQVKVGGMYPPESVQKVYDIASGKVPRSFLPPDPYMLNKNGFYGFPLMGTNTPPFFNNTNAGFFQPPPFNPMNFRPGLMGRFGPASFARSFNVPNNFPVPALRRGYSPGAGLPPMQPPTNFTQSAPNLPLGFPLNNIPNMPPNFGVGNIRPPPPPHTLTFRPRFPPNLMGPRPQHGFPLKPYDTPGKPGPGFRPGGYPPTRTMLQKPATQLLMEVHKSALTYECVKEEGPVHDRSYTMRVTVNGIEFHGKAKSKKRAKWVAAAEALKSVYKIQLQDSNNNNSSGSTTPTQPQSPTGDRRSSSPTASTTSSDSKVSLKPYHIDMPPVMLLNLLTNSALEYQCIGQDGPVHERLFTMKVTVEGVDFIGEGWNKRGAKAVAARKALAQMFNVHQ